MTVPGCEGCLYGGDVGVPEYSGIAYPHPNCPIHGWEREIDLEPWKRPVEMSLDEEPKL